MKRLTPVGISRHFRTRRPVPRPSLPSFKSFKSWTTFVMTTWFGLALVAVSGKAQEQGATWLPPLERPAAEQPPGANPSSNPPTSLPSTGPQAPSTSAPPSSPEGPLPWSRHDTRAAQPKTPREMLRLFQIDESKLRSLFDGEPLGANDEETLTTLLFRFPRMGEEIIYRWRTDTSLAELATEPSQHRASVVHVDGTVRSIERVELIPELQALYRFRAYWKLTIEASESPYSAIVCTRNIPPQWGEQTATDLDYEVSLDGFFLKTASADPAPPLIFAASRVQWHPTRPRPQLGVNASHVLLASHGMDVSWLAAIRKQNTKRLGADDRIGFYQMLAATQATTEAEIDTLGPTRASLASLLESPDKLHGDLIQIRVRAARVTRLKVQDSDVQLMQDIDHYYQVDAHLSLGEQSVRLGKDEDAPEYTNTFPVTLCMVDLPPSMQDVDRRLAAGESPSELLDDELLVDGFFFRIWSYRAGFVDARTPGELQPAPMVLAARLRVVQNRSLDTGTLSLVFGVGFVTLLAVVCGLLWWVSHKDAAVQKLAQERRHQKKTSLDELEL